MASLVFLDSVLHLQRDKLNNKCILDWRLANCSSSPEIEKCSHSDLPASLRAKLVRSLQHLHQERLNGRVSDQFEEKKVLQTLKPNGAQRRQPEEELSKSNWGKKKGDEVEKKKSAISSLLYLIHDQATLSNSLPCNQIEKRHQIAESF